MKTKSAARRASNNLSTSASKRPLRLRRAPGVRHLKKA
jgi:hypothetical protein